MKDWFKNENAIKALYLFLALAATIVFGVFVLNFGSILDFVLAFIGAVDSFIIGFAIAYILNPSYTFFREKVYGKFMKKSKKKIIKGLSILTLYIIVISALAFLIYIVVPQLVRSASDCVNNVVNNYPTYYKNVNDFVTNISGGNTTLLNTIIQNALNSFVGFVKGISTSDIMSFIGNLVKVSSVAGSVISSLFSVLIGVIISIYMLYNKEKFCAQIKKTGFALFSKRTMHRLQKWFGKSHLAFGQYLTGVVIDAFIVGLEFGLLCWIFRIPYAPMIAVILGLTNMIPFFGPYIGGVPCVLIVLMNNPIKAIILVAIMLAVQQIDGNLVAPKIIGQKTGLDAIWVIFAILVGGYFFGVLGMLLAVPVFSVLYLAIGSAINDRLKKKQLSTNTADYYASSSVAKKYLEERDK